MAEALLKNYQCDNDKFQSFYDELLADITNNRIILPSIPDVVFKIRQAVNDPNTDMNTLVSVLSTDAAMSARVLKVANSALYKRHSDQTDDLRGAVSRLGTSLVNALVTNLAIIQTLSSPLYQLGKHLRELFDHSTQVAANAYALAKTFTKINPEQALLAGMVHDIGYLPILQKAYGSRLIWENEQYLNDILKVLHAPVGGFVLHTWGFSSELVNTAIKHENVYYSSALGPDLIDLIIVADILTGDHDHMNANAVDISQVPAFAKVGVESIEALKKNEKYITLASEAKALFSV